MTTRRRINTRDRDALFIRKAGICHMCNGKVFPGQEWDVSHSIPLACGGADDETNWDVAHRRCHRVHTATVDAPMIAKVRRQGQKHRGATIKGGKLSPASPARRATTPPTKIAPGPTAWARRFMENAE